MDTTMIWRQPQNYTPSELDLIECSRCGAQAMLFETRADGWCEEVDENYRVRFVCGRCADDARSGSDGSARGVA